MLDGQLIETEGGNSWHHKSASAKILISGENSLAHLRISEIHVLAEIEHITRPTTNRSRCTSLIFRVTGLGLSLRVIVMVSNSRPSPSIVTTVGLSPPPTLSSTPMTDLNSR